LTSVWLVRHETVEFIVLAVCDAGAYPDNMHEGAHNITLHEREVL